MDYNPIYKGNMQNNSGYNHYYERARRKVGAQRISTIQKYWNEYIYEYEHIKENEEWYIISKDWFDKWTQYTDFLDGESNHNYNFDKNRFRMPAINNEHLLNHQEKLIVDNSNPYDQKDAYLTGRNLRDDLIVNKDYVIVTPNLFGALERLYGCDYPIYRYSVKNPAYNPTNTEDKYIIQTNLPKIKVIDVPKTKYINDFEYMQIHPKGCRIGDVWSCIKNGRSDDDIKIWKLEYNNEGFQEYYEFFKKQFKENKIVKVKGELLNAPYKSLERFEFSDREGIVIEYKINRYDKFSFVLDETKEEDTFDQNYQDASMFESPEHDTLEVERHYI